MDLPVGPSNLEEVAISPVWVVQNLVSVWNLHVLDWVLWN